MFTLALIALTFIIGAILWPRSEWQTLSPMSPSSEVIVPCMGHAGGVVIRYPASFSYRDVV